MLEPIYFNGVRDKEFEIFLSMVEGKKEGIRIRPVIEDLIVERLLIDRSVYEALKKFDSSLLQYLLPWTKDSKCVERKHAIRYKFPLVNGLETEVTKTYVLDHEVFGAFWYTRLYTRKPQFDIFSRIRETGFFRIDYELPGSRETVLDGQLKIVTDAILCANNIVDRTNCKILVVGSSSAGYHSGLAYDILDHLFNKSVFELYDPEGVSIEYVTDSNEYRHYAEKFDYDKDLSDYDMILDDAWDGNPHESRDPDWKIRRGVYSIKVFPTDKVSGRVYNQLFKTENMECRLVSHLPDYNYRHLRGLGSCSACVELKYCLQGDFSREFVEEFMSCHRINCRTGEYRSFFVGEEDIKLKFTVMEDLPESYMSEMYRLGWDSLLPQIMRSVPINRNLLKGADILVSDDSVLVNFVMKYARSIVKEDCGKFYYLGENKPNTKGWKKKIREKIEADKNFESLLGKYGNEELDQSEVFSSAERRSEDSQIFSVKRIADYNIYAREKTLLAASCLVKKKDFVKESKKHKKKQKKFKD